MTDVVIFTDLDGSLLDAETYAFQAALPALQLIQDFKIPLVLVSSKTRSELEQIRLRLCHRDPFIVENGGALFVPRRYFPFLIEQAALRDGYWAVEIGVPYKQLRMALKNISHDLHVELKGFGDMSVDEVAQHTGLSMADAALAKQREFDEPLVTAAMEETFERFQQKIVKRGLRCTKGGRFYHLTGANDKGAALQPLLDGYRRVARKRNRPLITIGIGDSLNDLPMLQLVDHPVLVQKPDGSYDPAIDLPHLFRASGIGPVGWNTSLLTLLEPLLSRRPPRIL